MFGILEKNICARWFKIENILTWYIEIEMRPQIGDYPAFFKREKLFVGLYFPVQRLILPLQDQC